MRKYKVTLREIVATYRYEIDAESEQEACEKATKLYMKGDKGKDEDRSFYVDASSSELFNLSDFWVRGESGTIYHVREGTGENLDEDDIESGYVDYIYYDEYDEDGKEQDGGMWLLEKPYSELSLEEILGTFGEPKMTIINEPKWAEEA